MPVSPVGNMNFINQNVGVHSHNVSNELAKEGFTSLANMAEFSAAKEKIDKKLEKVNEAHEVENAVNEKKEEETKRDKNSFFASKDEEEGDKEVDENSEGVEESVKSVGGLNLKV